MTNQAPVIVHSFETCTDPDCGDVLCGYYRAGLAAGHDFMTGAVLRSRALVLPGLPGPQARVAAEPELDASGPDPDPVSEEAR